MYKRQVEITCWGIRVTENLSAQKQTGRTYGMLITLGLSALIIGVGCTQYFMTKKIFAPITHILQVFAQIRESEDYSLRVHIQEKHETGELAAGINELLDYVEQADRKEKERQDVYKRQPYSTDSRLSDAFPNSLRHSVQYHATTRKYMPVQKINLYNVMQCFYKMCIRDRLKAAACPKPTKISFFS